MMKKLKKQLELTKKGLQDKSNVQKGLIQFAKLVQEFIRYVEGSLDKQINKVKKDVEKNNKPKAKKDIKKLLKMDKKFDKKIDKCDEKMMKKKK